MHGAPKSEILGIMINIEQLTPDAFRMTVIEEFRQEDAQQMVEFAETQLRLDAGGHLLIDLTAMTDFTFSAVSVELAHIPTMMKYIYGLDRIAVISDDDWIRTAARLESALLPGVVYQVYDEDEADAALAWITEASEQPHAGAFHEIDLGDPKIAAYELTGRIDREQSERGVAMVRARLEDPDCTRLLLVITNWHGFDLDRLLSREVLNGKLEIARKLERYAIVGGPKWVRGYAEFTGAFVKADIKGFDLEDRQKAIDWLNG